MSTLSATLGFGRQRPYTVLRVIIGPLPPVRRRNLVNSDSMVLGITHIDPWHEVDSHYHKETEVVIFGGGEGITRIDSEKYAPIERFNFIHPPSYSIHHTIGMKSKHPLKEIYFFPSGPFSTIKYIYK